MISFPVAALTICVCLVVLLLSEAEASDLKPCSAHTPMSKGVY